MYRGAQESNGVTMSRPRGGYRNNANKRVVGATTPIGRFKESGGMIHAAWQLGIDGLNYRDEWGKAAGVGTLAHDRCDALIHSRPWEYPADTSNEDRELVDNSYTAFEQWAKSVNMEIICTEPPMVSECYQFGGTPDAFGYCGGQLVVLDLKTGKTYPDHLIQLGAYMLLWEEHNPDKRIEAGHLLRIGKEYAEFTHGAYPRKVLDMGATQFLRLLECYHADKALKKAI